MGTSLIVLKNKTAIEKMRTAGKKLAQIMLEIEEYVVPGANTFDLDAIIEEKMRKSGLKPECKGYAGYRHATCISLNDGVVHGIPSKEVILKSGDFVKIDVVGSYQKYCADMTRPYFVGEVSPLVVRLARVAQRSLDAAIAKIAPNVFLSDISATVQQEVEQEGFGVVRQFFGHGIGRSIHEYPDVPNFGTPGRGPLLQQGMTLAIEPMITAGSYEIYVLKDGWTAKTKDGSLAAHVEDTVVVTHDGFEVLTRI